MTRRSLATQSQNQDAGTAGCAGFDLAEAEIGGEEDAILLCGPRQDLLVPSRSHVEVEPMNGIVTSAAKAAIDLEAHAPQAGITSSPASRAA
jgi:hypothetical protein